MKKLFTILLLTLAGCTLHQSAAQKTTQPHNSEMPNLLSRPIVGKKAESATQKPKKTVGNTPAETIRWTNVLWANGEYIAKRELPDSEKITILSTDLEGHFGILDVQENVDQRVYRLFVDLSSPNLPVYAIYTCESASWNLLATAGPSLQGEWAPSLDLEAGNVCGSGL